LNLPPSNNTDILYPS